MNTILKVGDLKNEMSILLDSEKHCRNSLAGSGDFEQPDPTHINHNKTKNLIFLRKAL